MQQGEQVLIFDNLGRVGVERNVEWLCETYGSKVQVEIADVRDAYRRRQQHQLVGFNAVYRTAHRQIL